MSSSTSALKARHYNALASSLRQLQSGLAQGEQQMDKLAGHLVSMQKMGTHSAAQFMAVSRLLDKELVDMQEESLAEQAGQGQEQAGP